MMQIIGWIIIIGILWLLAGLLVLRLMGWTSSDVEDGEIGEDGKWKEKW